MKPGVFSRLRGIVFDTIRKKLSQETRNRLKKTLLHLRRSNQYLYIAIYGHVNNDKLFEHIKDKLGNDYEILMLHTSYNAMMPMYNDNPKELIDLLIGYCIQNDITIVMPTFYLGINGFKPGEYYLRRNFIVKTSPSQTGYLAELFRRKTGVKRSIHPTHSVAAFGKLADEIVATHHLSDTPCGAGTPFDIMARYRTKILGIGVEYFRSLTQRHHAEDVLGEEYPIKFSLRKVMPVKCFDENNNLYIYKLKIFNDDYIASAKLKSEVYGNKILIWKFHGIPFFLTEAKTISDTIINAAKKGLTVYKK